MKKEEYERLKLIAIEHLKKSKVIPKNFDEKSMDELVQVNEIYQAELEAQNDELQEHVIRLEDAQTELEVLFNQAPIAYMVLTNKLSVLRANEEALKLFGSLHTLSKNMPFYTHIYKNNTTKFLDWIHNSREEKDPLEILLSTHKGVRYCRLRSHKWSISDKDTFLLSIEDIHQEKLERQRYESLFNNTQQGVIFIDSNHSIVDCNETATIILGLSKKNLLYKSMNNVANIFIDELENEIDVEDLPASITIRTQETISQKILGLKHFQKKVKWLKVDSIPYFNADTHNIKGVFCIFSDISKEYFLNKELKFQLESFTNLSNNIPDIILRVNNSKKLLFMNQEGFHFFDLNEEDTQTFKLCDTPIFKSSNCKEICTLLDDPGKITQTITQSISLKKDNETKNYFFRLVPELSEGILTSYLIIIEDITQRIESEDMFNQLFYNASDAIILTDNETKKLQSINSKAKRLLGIENYEINTLMSNDIFKSLHVEPDSYENHMHALETDGHDSYETQKVCADGRVVYLKVHCSLIHIGKRKFHQSIIHDLTEHKLLEKQLEQTSKVFEHTTEGILITDLDGTITSVNDAFIKITGYSRESVIGKNPSILESGRQDKSFYKKMWDEIKKNGVWKGEIWNKKKDGTIYPEWLAISAIYHNNEAVQYVAVFSDFSEIKNTQNKLKELAHYDQLTRLPNRTLLQEQLKFAVETAKRNKKQFAVMFIDLDRFKQINDTFGHKAGDEVLQETALRLKSVVRDSDIVARLGGDEFVVATFNIETSEDVERIAENILVKLQKPFLIENQEQFVTSSIGISIYPEDASDVDLLLKHADIAMYESKASGRNNYQFFATTMADSAKSILGMHNDINTALKYNEFYLMYQPQIDVVKNKIVGYEALIRWKHPEHGEIAPDKFIPYAEDSRLIVQVGQWVIEKVIQDYEYHLKKLYDKTTISVNVSHVQLSQEFVDYLHIITNNHEGIEKVLKLEITETAVMQHRSFTEKIMTQIKNLGFSISMDDFGTGYSSLNAIKVLKVDEIKIDREFIKDVPGDKEDEELVSTIIAMAKIMKKNIVAEGVEREETRDFLIERRCNVIQGYLTGKPKVLF